MCHFVTIVLPEGAKAERVVRIAAGHGATMCAVENPWLRKHLLPGETYFRATARHCDCGTVLGSAHAGAKRAEANEWLKVRRKGWSEAKIARWQTQREAAAESRAARARQPTDDEPDWLGLLRHVGEARAASSVGLLLHFYRHSVDDERFDIRERRILYFSNTIAEELGTVEEDVLYEIHVGRHAVQ